MPFASLWIVLPLVVPSAGRASPPEETGEPAPPVRLESVEGRAHDLAAQRGRIVVLEWTNHTCPAVARLHDLGLGGDTRRAVAGEDLVWWVVDSSWFAPASLEQIARYRRRVGLDAPYLLDRDGGVARALAVRATPQVVVVDAQGRVAYSGAFTDGEEGAARKNHVIEAVEDLRAGRSVRRSRTRARGCSVKLGTPRRFERDEIEDGAAANRAYARAASAARRGEHEAALERLDEAIGLGHEAPWRVLSDPDFRGFLDAPSMRSALRGRLAAGLPRGALTIVAPDEPGEPLVVRGRVLDPGGRPIANAFVGVYQTTAEGWYADGTTNALNPRLFGAVRSDARGRYRFRTIRPGHYADSRGPAHVHFDTRADGFTPHGGHVASLYFADDELLAGADRREVESDGCAIRSPARTAEGVALYEHDIVLQPAD